MDSKERQIYYRLIALWVICEAMLGGIIHGFKLPVSGLIVGGSAVICISLIAYLIPHRGAIIKATVVVAIFKMLLSPQSPFMAYVAVFFQGICGELFFSGKKNFRLRCYALAFISLLESAFQRVLVMTLIYGKDFWKELNDFIRNLTHSEPGTNYSLYFIAAYTFLHLIAALLIGKFTANIPKLLHEDDTAARQYAFRINPDKEISTAISRRKKFNGWMVVYLILCGIFIYNYFRPINAFENMHRSLKFIFHTAFVLLTWYLVIGPVLTMILKKVLEKKKASYSKDIDEILLLLPSAKSIVKESWRRSSVDRGLGRVRLFWKFLVVNSVNRE